jgi:hypothetical protein
MILPALVAMSLLVPVAVDRDDLGAPDAMPRNQSVPVWRKIATVRPLVAKATECIVRTVSADPRSAAALGGVALNEMIVDSVPSCLVPLRAMIEAYDQLFGEGAGEQFFVGPYLDGLPAAVGARIEGSR